MDVGRRDLPHVAVHEDARHVLRPLVDGARRVDVRHARLADEQRHVATEREAVADRVADERGDRVDAVPLEHAVEQLLAARERLVPGDLAPRVAVAHHRLRGAVGVVVQVAERRALRAEVALRPHVVAVAADQLDVLVLDVDLQAAHALAQRTRHEMSLHRSSISRRSPRRPDHASSIRRARTATKVELDGEQVAGAGVGATGGAASTSPGPRSGGCAPG